MRKKEKEITDIHGIELIIQRSDVCRLAFADRKEKLNLCPGKMPVTYIS